MKSDLAILTNSVFFAHLSRKAAAALSNAVTLKNFREDEFVFKEGEPARFFCLVLRGFVKLSKTCETGRIASLRVCEPGDVFAECMLRAGPDYAYSAQAAEDCIVALFDLDTVRAIAQEDRSVDAAIMHVLSRNLLSTLNCIAEDRMHTAPQRLAAYLLQTVQDDKKQAGFRLPFRKSLLAAKLGLTPEGLSRAFALLKEHGIAVQGRTIRIENSDALRGL